MSEFSDFFINAPPEEKRVVFERVMAEVSKMQSDTIRSAAEKDEAKE